MRTELESRLRKAVNVDEVKAILRAACEPHGEVIRIGVMYSTHATLPRHMTCVVEMEEKIAVDLARQLGAANLGSRIVLFSCELPEDFAVELG